MLPGNKWGGGFFIAVVILLMALPALAQPGTWQTVTSQDGGFSVMAPGTPVEKTRQFDLKTSFHAYGQIARKEVILKGAGTVFRVAYYDLPGDLLQRGGPSLILDALAASRLQRMKSEAVSRSEVKLGSYSGLQMVRRLTNGVTVTLRIYLVGGRCYELLTAQRQPNDAVVSRFMDSFTLLGQ